jgi:hypothetical protein
MGGVALLIEQSLGELEAGAHIAQLDLLLFYQQRRIRLLAVACSGWP